MTRKKFWDDDDTYSGGRPVQKDYYGKYRHRVYDEINEDDEDLNYGDDTEYDDENYEYNDRK